MRTSAISILPWSAYGTSSWIMLSRLQQTQGNYRYTLWDSRGPPAGSLSQLHITKILGGRDLAYSWLIKLGWGEEIITVRSWQNEITAPNGNLGLFFVLTKLMVNTGVYIKHIVLILPSITTHVRFLPDMFPYRIAYRHGSRRKKAFCVIP